MPITDLASGAYIPNMLVIYVDPIDELQLTFLEFFVIEKWLKRYCKNEWYIEYNSKIIVYFSNKNDLCNFKMCDISSRFNITNIAAY